MDIDECREELVCRGYELSGNDISCDQTDLMIITHKWSITINGEVPKEDLMIIGRFLELCHVGQR